MQYSDVLNVNLIHCHVFIYYFRYIGYFRFCVNILISNVILGILYPANGLKNLIVVNSVLFLCCDVKIQVLDP
jgi:hypothetical protein